MITSLSLANFKSWESIDEMRLAPITGLFGPNSSGKTSILQLLLLLKQTVESSDRAQVLQFGDESSMVNLGSFPEVIHGHDLEKLLTWALQWKLPDKLEVTDPADPDKLLFSSDHIGFNAEIMGKKRHQVKKMMYQLGDNCFSMEFSKTFGTDDIKEGKEIALTADTYKLLSDAGGFEFIRMPGRSWILPKPVKCYGFPDQVKAYYQNAGFLADFQLAFEQLFDRVYYLGPLRDYPKRQYIWTGAAPMDVGQRGERVVDAILAASVRQMSIPMGKGNKRRSLEEHVAWWLRELGLIHSFSVDQVAKDSNIYRVKVKKSAQSAEVLITDVGFGVSQILPVLVLCFYVPEGSTIILEQPEIHLHPSVQAGLADVFIDAMKRRKVQIILESHSEYLLRRLQRRIAEENLEQADTALYFCEMGNSHSVLTPLQLDQYGNITNWPKDFFGDESGELAATTEARMKRKIREKQS